MINWVIIYCFYYLIYPEERQKQFYPTQGVTNLMFYFKTKKILEKYFPINKRFKFV